MSQSVLYDVQGPRARRRILIGSAIATLAVLALLYLAVQRLADNGQLDAERYRPFFEEPLFWERMGEGLVNTLKAAAYGLVLASLTGVVLAFGRLSHTRVLRMPAVAIIEFFRATPLLLLILAFFLAFPIVIGVSLDPLWALVLGLTLYNGAVIAEIIRAGIQSLPKGQTEAALACGLTRGQALRMVLLPQAVRIMLPSLVSQLVVLLKDTSLGFVIGFEELLRTGRFLGETAEFGQSSLQIIIVVATIYIVINLALGLLANWIESRQRQRLGSSAAAMPANTPVAMEQGSAPL